ncbi:HutD family protein [Rhizobium vallis]|uniref:HutD family protein n=1 Tax=Rhizobium vallis TaxID=634290 RepID=A0A432PRF9_9HYPH|nr:HutD family protein [Rhizobium vallis]RUM27069.1 HutD family protein [Rhizobium vallis]
MKILRASEHKRMPWKNGKGETVEIAVFPPDASIDDFDWRVSTATVAEDGPFSIFPGIDRTLSVLTGEGIALSVEGTEAVELRPPSAPHAFPADTRTAARLLDGPITDLNVMTRRGAFRHSVKRTTSDDDVRVGPSSAAVLLVVNSYCQIVPDGAWLEPLDALLLEPDTSVRLRSNGLLSIFEIEISSEAKR